MSHLIQILSAFWLGALHALEPGHGKGVIGAYLVLSRGKPLHAVILGLTSALSHTLVVILLAVTAHAAAATLRETTGEPGGDLKLWLHFITGVLIVFIGFRLFSQHHSGLCCSHHPRDPGNHSPNRSLRLFDLLLLGFTNGLIPCPGALAVLLLSVSTGNMGSGLLIVFAFGAGAAVAMIGVGMFFIKISSLTSRFINIRTWSRLAATAGVIVMGAGLYMALTAALGITQENGAWHHFLAL